MRYILLALILPLFSTIHTQDYEPTLQEGAFWRIGIGQGMGSYRSVYVRLMCDTITINNKDYNVVTIEDEQDDCVSSVAYVREDREEQQVFFLGPGYDEEVLIADYSLMIGDSMQFVDWGAPLRLDTIYYREFAGEMRKYFFFSNDHNGYYEGVGSNSFGVVPLCSGYDWLLDFEVADSCHDPVSTNDQEGQYSFTLYPNPNAGQFFLRLEQKQATDITIQVFDASGRLIHKELHQNTDLVFEKQFDLTALPAGVYQLLLDDGVQFGRTKVVVIK
ncbi:MAG: T9SS type A sorting domain-containing protein [Bacteroidota bacterium]